MFRKINTSLLIIAIVGALVTGASLGYDHFSTLSSNKIIKQLEG